MEPAEFFLKPGETIIGRGRDTVIQISDPSSSREHCLITYNEHDDIATIFDLESTNGTFVNQQRLDAPHRLQSGDRIRIGSSLLIAKQFVHGKSVKDTAGTATYTKELLSQAVDYHTVLMYEIAQQLNRVVDIDEALKRVSALMKVAMGADQCIVILKKEFDNLANYQIPRNIVDKVVKTKTATLLPEAIPQDESISTNSTLVMHIGTAICVPVILNDEVVAIIYLDKRQVEAKNYDRDDLHLVIAISHQVALTIHRMNLMDQLGEEVKIRQTLQRFISPQETEYLLNDILGVNQLPGLSKQFATVLFVDIAASTRLAEKLGPQDFGELLNRFYLEVTEIIFKYNGIIRYLGDGVMAIFLGDEIDNITSKIAINTGLDILEYIKTSRYPITIGVTIKSGDVVVGYVGNTDRVEFTVLGDAVNVAHGMQSYARPNRLVVGKETIMSLSPKSDFKFAALSPIQVKDREELVDIYEVLERTKSIGVDTVPPSQVRRGTSELLRMLPQRMSKDILS